MSEKVWRKNAQSYESFLFAMLYAEIYKEEAENMSYDFMHEVVVNLHNDFNNSPYDDSDVDLYTCIVDFLNDSKQLIITYGEKETKAV